MSAVLGVYLCGVWIVAFGITLRQAFQYNADAEERFKDQEREAFQAKLSNLRRDLAALKESLP